MFNYQYILVVDDNVGVRRLLYELLSDAGYNVEMASSGEEAMHKINERIPILIFLDIRMPGMNGFETLKHLKRFSPFIPVITISAYSNNDINEALQSGIICYHMEKPFDIQKVLELGERIFRFHTLSRENLYTGSLNK